MNRDKCRTKICYKTIGLSWSTKSGWLLNFCLHQSKRRNAGEVPKEYQATAVIALLLWHECLLALWVLEWQQASADLSSVKAWKIDKYDKYWTWLNGSAQISSALSSVSSLFAIHFEHVWTSCHVQLRVKSCRLCGTLLCWVSGATKG